MELHATLFSSFQVQSETPSLSITFAMKSINSGQLTLKLHVPKLDAYAGKPKFSKKNVDISFPFNLGDSFLITIYIFDKYKLIYVITKFIILLVYDLETTINCLLKLH